jgi:hypothetical protein
MHNICISMSDDYISILKHSWFLRPVGPFWFTIISWSVIEIMFVSSNFECVSYKPMFIYQYNVWIEWDTSSKYMHAMMPVLNKCDNDNTYVAMPRNYT